MRAKCQGGPYDGLELDHNDINLYLSLRPCGRRTFLFFPPPDQWEAVKHGELSRDGPFNGDCPVYELVRLGDGNAVCIFDPDGSRLWEAGEQLARTPAEPVRVPDGYQIVNCWLGKFQGMTLPEPLVVIVDEKDRTWACCSEEHFSKETEQLLKKVAGDKMDERERFSARACRTREELIHSLSDVLD